MFCIYGACKALNVCCFDLVLAATLHVEDKYYDAQTAAEVERFVGGHFMSSWQMRDSKQGNGDSQLSRFAALLHQLDSSGCEPDSCSLMGANGWKISVLSISHQSLE